MTCARCDGLMVLDYWETTDGLAGIDWRCCLCSARIPMMWRQDYDPPRPVPPKAKYAPEQDEFVLRRDGEFFHRKTRV